MTSQEKKMARTFHTFDLIIIGGGTAGLSALKEAKKHTDNVLLIHDGPNGTTCARTGCMPSKALIHAAKLYHDRHKMAEAGIKQADKLEADIPSILKNVREKRDYFIQSIDEQVKEFQPHIIQGHGRFDSPTTVRANGKLLHAKATVVATGSSPYIPEPYLEFTDKILTTDNLFEQKNLPRRIAVIGLGPVGLELSQSLARLGIEVTACDRHDQIGGIADKDINKTIIQVLQKDMRLWLGAEPTVERSGDALMVKSHNGAVEVDALMITAGRKPNLGSLGLKRIGASIDSEGIPHFNRMTMQIKDLPIYIAGDATDERAVMHEAADEGRRAAYYAITGDERQMQRCVQMAIIFTHPTIAVIGDSNQAMRWNGVTIGESSFEDQGRATIENENHGKIRIAANKDDGRLRGCEMMAPEGEHLAHLMAFALEQRLTVEEMLEMPFYHPSFEEGLRSALKHIVTSS
jgi:dihydrolipoamide dehydrogenase